MESGRRAGPSSDVDGGWAWVVLLSTFLAFAILWGQVYSFNIYFVIFLRAFGESRSYTAWIGSLNLAVIQLAAICVGFLISRFGARGTTVLGSCIAALGYVACSFSNGVLHLMISYGIIVAFGLCIIVYGCLEAIGRHFHRRLYPATGFSISGGGVGIMCMTYLNQWLIDEYGWRGALLIQGGIALQLAALGCTFFPVRRQRPGMAGVGATPAVMSWKQRVTDVRTVMLVVACTAQGFGIFSLYVVYKDLAIARGLEASFPATMMAVGVGNIVGRASSGVIVDYWSPILFYTAANAVCATVMFVNVFDLVPEVFVLLGGVLGFSHGGISTVLPLAVAFMFGRHEMAVTFGYLVFWSGFGTLIGPPLAGFLTDRSGSYTPCLLTSGSGLVVSMVFTIILHYIHGRRIVRASRADECNRLNSTVI